MAVRPVRPRAHPAAHHPLVLGLLLRLRFRGGLSAAPRHPHPARHRLRRRMGGGRRAARRDDRAEASRQGARHRAERRADRIGHCGPARRAGRRDVPARHRLALRLLGRPAAGLAHLLRAARIGRFGGLQAGPGAPAGRAAQGEPRRHLRAPGRRHHAVDRLALLRRAGRGLFGRQFPDGLHDRRARPHPVDRQLSGAGQQRRRLHSAAWSMPM